MVRLSDSFSAAVDDLLAGLGAASLEWKPGTDPAPPSGAAAVVILAGGAEADALDLLDGLPGEQPRFLVGASTDHRLAAAALQRGARDYFALPGDLELLRRSLEREGREATGRSAAKRLAAAERLEFGFDAIVGQSTTLLQTLELGRRAARHRDVTVLLGGETGTGKELLARALHYESPRAAGPFVDVNCAAIPANLLESELFGHEKGSFTGAIAAKPGLLELANGGTILLDEVGHLPLELQPKLLRALETREIRRVGGQASRKVDVRIVGATHLNLAGAVRRKEFREDLFYRLNVITLVLPPLRERGSDIELLAETFVARLSAQYNLPAPPLTAATRTALRAYHWPGNVRELKNTIERALVLSPPGTLELTGLVGQREVGGMDAGAGVIPFPASLRTITQAAVAETLQLAGGNKSEAARRLGISRPRLIRIMEGKEESGE